MSIVLRESLKGAALGAVLGAVAGALAAAAIWGEWSFGALFAAPLALLGALGLGLLAAQTMKSSPQLWRVILCISYACVACVCFVCGLILLHYTYNVATSSPVAPGYDDSGLWPVPFLMAGVSIASGIGLARLARNENARRQSEPVRSGAKTAQANQRESEP